MSSNHNIAYLTAAAVMARYGISAPTLWRWTNSPDLKFPQPMTVNKRRFWRIADLERFEARRQAHQAKAA